MRSASILLACLLAFGVALPVQAGGHGHHHGGHDGGYYRGSGHHWLAPVLGAAWVGSVIYAASAPSYAAPVFVQPPQYVPPSRVAYFCPTSQQYYPHVPTCYVPWQPVTY